MARDSQEWAQLIQLAFPVSGRPKPRKEQVEATILTLCQGRWLLLRDLAELLQRDPDWLRKNYLSPMVDQGRLQHRYAASPRHSRQAYQATTPRGAP